MCDELVEDLVAFEVFVFSSRVSLHIFRTLHTSASLSALRQRRGQWRAVTSYGELWRHFLPPIRHETGRLLPALGAVRVAVSGGLEYIALAATLGFEEG